jgi:hypothetical protein
MSRIYRCASQVISYLGPEDKTDREGFELPDKIHEQYHHLRLMSLLHENIDQTAEKFLDSTQIPYELRFRRQVSRSAWRSLGSIIYGAWTRRLWMIQEVRYDKNL